MENIKSNDVNNDDEVSSARKPRNEFVALLSIREKRKKMKPHFTRQESWRYKRIATSWRRPKGIDSRMRLRKRSQPKLVKVGYRSPRKIRGFHPSGFKEKLVFNVEELKGVDLYEVVRIAHTVGLKKRLKIIDKARELGLRVLNTRGVGTGEPERSKKTGI